MPKEFPYGIVEPSKIPDVADRILDEYFELVKSLKIPTCLAYGLCLGFVRDGGYVLGDNDLDVIAITPTNRLIPALGEALTEHGFKKGMTFPNHNNVHFHKDKILLDIFFRAATKFYSKFGTVMYKNKAYLAPSPIEEYLSACYGDWRVKSDIPARCI